jgi:hypothetical protein
MKLSVLTGWPFLIDLSKKLLGLKFINLTYNLTSKKYNVVRHKHFAPSNNTYGIVSVINSATFDRFEQKMLGLKFILGRRRQSYIRFGATLEGRIFQYLSIISFAILQINPFIWFNLEHFGGSNLQVREIKAFKIIASSKVSRFLSRSPTVAVIKNTRGIPAF